MKNKKLHFDLSGFSLKSGEKRLIFVDAPPTAPSESERVAVDTKKGQEFVDKLCVDLPGFDKNVLEKNPFAKDLIEFAKKVDMSFKAVVPEKGKFVLKYEGGKPVVEVTGMEYAALQWKKIKAKLDELFKAEEFHEDLYIYVGEKKGPAFSTVVWKLAKEETPTPVEVAAAIKELNEFADTMPAIEGKEMAKTRGQQDRIKMRAAVERDRQRRRMPEMPIELPTQVKLDKEKFADKAGKVKDDWDRIQINVLREQHKVNAQKWDHTNEVGIKHIYKDLYDLGFNLNDEFYQTFFALLKNATDPAKNTYLSDPTYLTWFQQPAKHMKDLMGLSAVGDFDPAAFAQAYAHMQALQGLLLSQDQSQLNTLEKQRDLDSEPAAEKVTKFFRDNYSKFTQAIRDRDYATAGMYAVGIFALYKTYNALAEKAGDNVKYLWYGIAAYTGHTFLKNAGYDLPKMAGFRDMDYEAKGTPLAAMDNIIKQSEPKLANELKDLDYGIVVQMSETSLVDMQKLLDETNDHGIKFIHPYNFPRIFPDLAGEWPFEMGIGENGDYAGLSHSNLTSSQKEYIRVGQQLYKMALGLRTVYDNTLKKDHTNYKGIAYEEAIQDNATRSLGKVRHLLDAVSHYTAPEKQDKLFGSTISIDKAHGELSGAFKNKEVAFYLERQIEKANHFEGEIMDFPLVFVLDGDKYRVYLKNNYGGVEMPGKEVAAEIPVADGAEKEAAGVTLIKAVKDRMKELLRPLQGKGGRTFEEGAEGVSINYKDGEWTTKVTFPDISGLGIKSETEDAIITPWKTGKGVEVVTKSGLRLSLDEEAIKQRPMEFALITKLVGQTAATGRTSFAPLRAFSNANRLRTKDVNPTTGNFTLLVGNKGIPVEMIYIKGSDTTPGHFEFADVSADRKLVTDPGFADEYIDALQNDPRLEFNKTCDDLKVLINEACPQSFLKYFYKTLAGSTVRGELRGFNTDLLSGSVPHNFTNMIVDVLKFETFAKLKRKMRSAQKLEDIQTMMNDIMSDTNNELKALYDNVSSKNTDLKRSGEDWERTQFMLGVLDKIRQGDGKSSQYTLARTDLEYMLYQTNLPGWATGSDLNENSHMAVGKMLNVFAYYTAHLDSSNLDKLTYPPTPTSGTPSSDPALEGHFILRYLDFVKDRIINEPSNFLKGQSLDPSLIPGPTDARWKIPEFEAWKNSSEGRYDALDPLDNKPPFEHKQEDHYNGNHTELDKEMKRRLETAKDRVIDVVKEDLNLVALEDYFNSEDPDNLGIFVIFEREDLPGVNQSGLWEKTNPIARVAGSKRSVQVRLMQNEVNEFIDYIFSEEGRSKFFLEKPGVWERVKTYYYKLKYDI